MSTTKIGNMTMATKEQVIEKTAEKVSLIERVLTDLKALGDMNLVARPQLNALTADLERSLLVMRILGKLGIDPDGEDMTEADRIKILELATRAMKAAVKAAEKA